MKRKSFIYFFSSHLVGSAPLLSISPSPRFYFLSYSSPPSSPLILFITSISSSTSLPLSLLLFSPVSFLAPPALFSLHLFYSPLVLVASPFFLSLCGFLSPLCLILVVSMWTKSYFWTLAFYLFFFCIHPGVLFLLLLLLSCVRLPKAQRALTFSIHHTCRNEGVRRWSDPAGLSACLSSCLRCETSGLSQFVLKNSKWKQLFKSKLHFKSSVLCEAGAEHLQRWKELCALLHEIWSSAWFSHWCKAHMAVWGLDCRAHGLFALADGSGPPSHFDRSPPVLTELGQSQLFI